jgi:hypothetical protein
MGVELEGLLLLMRWRLWLLWLLLTVTAKWVRCGADWGGGREGLCDGGGVCGGRDGQRGEIEGERGVICGPCVLLGEVLRIRPLLLAVKVLVILVRVHFKRH